MKTRVKEIVLPNGGLILDGFSHLIVFTPEFVSYMKENKAPVTHYLNNFFCKAEKFITKKGRNAIKIDLGISHTIKIKYGSGDKSWGNWDKRKLVNAFYAEAVRNSNGGGCWVEVIIMEVGKEIITTEQASYMEDLDL